MTDIRKLMEEATPLPWNLFSGSGFERGGEYVGETTENCDADLVLIAVNALPAVLELMDAVENMLKGDGYLQVVKAKRDALARALGEQP